MSNYEITAAQCDSCEWNTSGDPGDVMQDQRLHFEATGHHEFTGQMRTVDGSEVSPEGFAREFPGRPVVWMDEDASEAQMKIGLWWMEAAARDLQGVMPKIEEYTSADLEVMGSVMTEWGLSGETHEPGSDQHWVGMEAACAWYLLGKVARCVAAYREGRLPSLDTLHDITVYSMMMRRIRETGRWP